MPSPEVCPVCRAPSGESFQHIEGKSYWRCRTCEATWLDPAHHLSRHDEYAHYLHHENHVDDPGYRRFLSKLSTPLLSRLAPGQQGLDFGCGPGPALAAMLREAGHDMALYDPFFHDEPSALARDYDFITCTETVEHLHAPADVFDQLDGMLRPGGWLAVMTCFQTEDTLFATWHYRRDPTHVVFFRPRSFEVIAAQRRWTCDVARKDVALMQKPLLKRPLANVPVLF